MDEQLVEDEIRELEMRLLAPSVRAARAYLEPLISDDFVEFGSSGRVYDKSKTIAVLNTELEGRPEPPAVSELRVLMLGAGAALVTYRCGPSLRSSVWRREALGWRVVFHQGTPSIATPVGAAV
jgi:hypothetical protein